MENKPKFLSNEEMDALENTQSKGKSFISDEEMNKIEQSPEAKADTGAHGYVTPGRIGASLQAMTGNVPFNKQLIGAAAVAKELGTDLYEKVTGNEREDQVADNKKLLDVYYAAQEAKRQKEEQASADYPGTYLASSLATGFALPGPKLLGDPATKASTQFIKSALGAAGAGALAGATEGSAKTLQGEIGKTVNEAKTGAGIGLALNAATRVPSAVASIAKGAAGLGKKVISEDFVKNLSTAYNKGKKGISTISKNDLEQELLANQSTSNSLRNDLNAIQQKFGQELGDIKSDPKKILSLRETLLAEKSKLSKTKPITIDEAKDKELAENTIDDFLDRTKQYEVTSRQAIVPGAPKSYSDVPTEEFYNQHAGDFLRQAQRPAMPHMKTETNPIPESGGTDLTGQEAHRFLTSVKDKFTPYGGTKPDIKTPEYQKQARDIFNNVNGSFQEQLGPEYRKASTKFGNVKDIKQLAGLTDEPYLPEATKEVDKFSRMALGSDSPERKVKTYQEYQAFKNKLNSDLPDVAKTYIPALEDQRQTVETISKSIKVPEFAEGIVPAIVGRGTSGVLKGANTIGRMKNTLDTSDKTIHKFIRGVSSGGNAAAGYSESLYKALTQSPGDRAKTIFGLMQQPAFRQLVNDTDTTEEQP